MVGHHPCAVVRGGCLVLVVLLLCVVLVYDLVVATGEVVASTATGVGCGVCVASNDRYGLLTPSPMHSRGRAAWW